MAKGERLRERPRAARPGAWLPRLVPLFLAAAGAAFLLVFRGLVLGAASLLPALLALAGGLLVLHGLLALRLRQTTAFLSGLELAYATLLLLRSHTAPLLSLGLPAFARILALAVPVSLVLVHALGQGSLLGARATLRAGLIVALPLLCALALRAYPAAAVAVLELRLAAAAPSALPQLGLAALPGLGLLLAFRRGRGLYDLCLAATLLPRYLLLQEAASGARPGFPARASLTAALCLLSLLYGLYRQFWQRAFQDELTGIGNRRSFEDALWALPRRFSLAMIDVDHFKAVNDTYGHAEGDNVLRWVAARIRDAFGPGAFRYGGEEFAVLLPEADPTEARQRLEALRRGLAEATFAVRRVTDRRRKRRRAAKERRAAGQDRRRAARAAGPRTNSARTPAGSSRLKVTVSIGLCSAAGGFEGPEEALRRADEALYRAKNAGRDRVVSASAGTSRRK